MLRLILSVYSPKNDSLLRLNSSRCHGRYDCKRLLKLKYEDYRRPSQDQEISREQDFEFYWILSYFQVSLNTCFLIFASAWAFWEIYSYQHKFVLLLQYLLIIFIFRTSTHLESFFISCSDYLGWFALRFEFIR